MKAEKPAEGILKHHDWGDTMTYQVSCQCGDADHNHTVWVEAEDTGVNVVVYTRSTSRFWTAQWWQQIWQILSKGYIEEEVGIILSEQQALNYAETLKTAIADVKKFKEANKK